MTLKSKLRSSALDIAIHLDKAIELGIKAAYPMVFNLPPPDDFDWRQAAKLGWKLVKTTAKETANVVVQQWRDEEKR